MSKVDNDAVELIIDKVKGMADRIRKLEHDGQNLLADREILREKIQQLVGQVQRLEETVQSCGKTISNLELELRERGPKESSWYGSSSILEALKASGSDLTGVSDPFVAIKIVIGDLKGAEKGRDFFAKELGEESKKVSGLREDIVKLIDKVEQLRAQEKR